MLFILLTSKHRFTSMRSTDVSYFIKRFCGSNVKMSTNGVLTSTSEDAPVCHLGEVAGELALNHKWMHVRLDMSMYRDDVDIAEWNPYTDIWFDPARVVKLHVNTDIPHWSHICKSKAISLTLEFEHTKIELLTDLDVYLDIFKAMEQT